MPIKRSTTKAKRRVTTATRKRPKSALSGLRKKARAKSSILSGAIGRKRKVAVARRRAA